MMLSKGNICNCQFLISIPLEAPSGLMADAVVVRLGSYHPLVDVRSARFNDSQFFADHVIEIKVRFSQFSVNRKPTDLPTRGAFCQVGRYQLFQQ